MLLCVVLYSADYRKLDMGLFPSKNTKVAHAEHTDVGSMPGATTDGRGDSLKHQIRQSQMSAASSEAGEVDPAIARRRWVAENDVENFEQLTQGQLQQIIHTLIQQNQVGQVTHRCFLPPGSSEGPES